MLYLNNISYFDFPYKHFICKDILEQKNIDNILKLDIEPGYNGLNGTRNIIDNSRIFLNNKICEKYPPFFFILKIFEEQETKLLLTKKFNVDFKKYKNLRIEYTQDTGNFHLKPHTDVETKGITLIIYLSPDLDENIGTDLYNSKKEHIKKINYQQNVMLGFIPNEGKTGIPTYHGLEPIKIKNIRKMLIINYVSDDWKNKCELTNYVQ